MRRTFLRSALTGLAAAGGPVVCAGTATAAEHPYAHTRLDRLISKKFDKMHRP